MAKSLFQKNKPGDSPPTPHELIEPEIVHLKKGYSIRHGPKGRPKKPLWIVVLGFCGLAWLYLMDPVMHSWYKGDAIEAYLYLHNYGSGPLATQLATCQIFTADEVDTLNHRTGSFQSYYVSPDAANKQAEIIIKYMADVRLLHDGRYEQLDPVGRMRYLLFIWPGLVLPTQWAFLDPTVSSDDTQ